MTDATSSTGPVQSLARLYTMLRASKLGRNIANVYGGDLLAKAIGVITTILLIRVLSVNDYAAYVAFTTVLFLFPGLIGNGVNLALVRFAAEHISRTGERPLDLYATAVLLQVVMYAITCTTLLVYSEATCDILFGEKDFLLPFRIGLIAGFGYLVTQAGRRVYQAEEQFGYFVKVLWLRQSSILILMLSLFFFHRLNFAFAASALTIVELGVAMVVMAHVFRGIGIRHFKAAATSVSPLTGVFFVSAGWLIVYIFLLTSFESLDIFLLSHLASTSELANYGVASRYYGMALLLLASINAVLLPRFSKEDMQDARQQREFTRRWLKFSGWLIVPIILGAWILKPAFIFVNGVQYEAAFPILMVFSVGVWLSLAFSPLVNVLMSRRAFRFLVLLAAIALTVNAVGNYAMVPRWGGLAAAYVTIASYALINVSSAIRVFFSES